MEPTIIFGNQFNDIVLPLLADVDFNVDIVIFDWRFENKQVKSEISKFNTAIVSLAGRGIKVRAIVNNQTIADRLNGLGIRAKVWNKPNLLHTKLLILDKKNIVIGSHNYSESAFTSNAEISCFFSMFEDKNSIIDYFENLWSY